MQNLEALSNRSIGYRVKSAREVLALTQDQLSQSMGFNDRQTISDLENGKRSLKAEELIKLADLLGREVDFFLDPFMVVGEAQFSWRVAPEVPEESLNDFELRAGRLIGLLRWLRTTDRGPASPLKSNLRLTKQSSFEDAQERAEELVKLFNLGPIPADRLIECMERELDLPVLFLDIPEGSSISGATCHLNDMGVVLVNRQESEGRRFYDLAHELFHALTWDSMKPCHRDSNSRESRHKDKKIEQLADNFAAALLMPSSSLEVLVDPERIEDSTHLAEVAGRFRVTLHALGWRLFNMRKISEATRSALVYERPCQPTAKRPNRYSTEFVVMLSKAIDRGKLSSRKAAKSLGMTLSSLAGLFEEYGLPVPFEM